MSNFQALFNNHNSSDIQEFQKILNNFRKNKKTKKQKIGAITNQVNYMNLMFNAGNELGGKQGVSFSKLDNGFLSNFGKVDIDTIFSELHLPRGKQTKTTFLDNVESVYAKLHYYDLIDTDNGGGGRGNHLYVYNYDGGNEEKQEHRGKEIIDLTGNTGKKKT